MNVLHINTDTSKGGAAIAASRHCEAMKLAGINATLLSVGGQENKFSVVFKDPFQKSFFYSLKKKFLKKIKRLLLRKVAWHWVEKGCDISQLAEVKNADLIYIHWINDFLGYDSIEALLKLGKPVVWFLHDMWPFTGGCHYSFDCDNYIRKCENCPEMRFLKVFASVHLQKKIEAWSAYKNLVVAAPSTWLTNCGKKSALFCERDCITIRNVIDTNLFLQKEKKFTRKKLGLPAGKKLILFSAMGTANPYKGTKFLIETISRIKNENFEFVVVGRCDLSIFSSDVKKKIHLIGFVKDQQKMIDVYNSADVLLITSMAENFPNVVIEAMACGVPVVGFSTGGIKDQIQHKVNGWIVPPRDVDGLLEGINWVLSNERYQELQKNARNFVEQNCSYRHVLDIHKPIFDNFLK